MRICLLVLLLAGLPSFAQSHILERSEGYEGVKIAKLSAAFLYLATTTGLRGTHSKGVCADAEFTVKNHLPDEMHVGVFRVSGTYRARVRFANAASKIAPDPDYDGRALSIAVDFGGRGRQDFVVQNSPIFPIPSLEDFVLLLGHVRDPAALANRPAGEQARLEYMLKAAKTFSPAPKSYLTETYWSGTAFAFGETQAVKYIVVPCEQNKNLAVANGPEYLGISLKNHLASADEPAACFDFRVQPLNTPAMVSPEGRRLESWEWVENPTLEWKETEAPSYSVATLTLKKGSVYSPEKCDARSNAFAVMSNTLPEHRGLGRINRGRSWPEYMSGVGRSF
jgi:catalase